MRSRQSVIANGMAAVSTHANIAGVSGERAQPQRGADVRQRHHFADERRRRHADHMQRDHDRGRQPRELPRRAPVPWRWCSPTRDAPRARKRRRSPRDRARGPIRSRSLDDRLRSGSPAPRPAGNRRRRDPTSASSMPSAECGAAERQHCQRERNEKHIREPRVVRQLGPVDANRDQKEEKQVPHGFAFGAPRDRCCRTPLPCASRW